MLNRAILKGFFETGDTPTQAQFSDLIDSMFNKIDDATAWADVSGKPTTFAPSAHNHAASDVNSGVFDAARLASGATTNGYMIQLVAGVPTWVAAPSGGSGTPAGASGQVQFNTGGAFAASSNFFWDATNNRLGIGTGSPSYALDINGTARIQTVPTIVTATKMLVKDPTTGQVSEQLLPSGGGGTPAGATTQIQYNSAGAFGASSDFTYDNTTKSLVIGGAHPDYGRGNVRATFGFAAINPSDPNSMLSITSESDRSQIQSYNGANLVLNPFGNNVAIGKTSVSAGYMLDVNGAIKSNGVITLTVYTVATLPTPSQGMTAYVSDASSPTYLATVVGGGSIKCPVFYNGTNWVCH